jgi:hypothetical protein
VPIKVQYTGHLRADLGIACEWIPADGRLSLYDVVAILRSRHGSALDRFVDTETGAISSGVLISVDDVQVRNDPNRLLEPDCTVTLLAAISGG